MEKIQPESKPSQISISLIPSGKFEPSEIERAEEILDAASSFESPLKEEIFVGLILKDIKQGLTQ